MRKISAAADALSLFDLLMTADGTAALVPWSAREDAAARRILTLPDRDLPDGWKDRARANIDAIRLARTLAAEGRAATDAERAALNRYVGFGAGELANAIFRNKGRAFRPGWEALGEELESLVPASDRAALSRSTQYSHYTPEGVLRGLWLGARKLGFAGGRILEPGCGTGLALSCAPADLAAASTFVGYEVEPTAAAIASAIHPGHAVRVEDFTKAALTGPFDLAIGNPPFSSRTVSNGKGSAGRKGFRLHDYFIARAVESLREGGIAAFVTSHGTMDKAGDAAREHIASMADLVAAVRLPQGSMSAAAGTEVVIDLLLLRRRADGAPAGGAEWIGLAEVEDADGGEPLRVNRYFAEHPEMVLGRHAWTSSPFGPVYTCRGGVEGLEGRLAEAIALLPDAEARVGTGADGAEAEAERSTPRERAKEGSYLVVGGVLQQVVDGRAVPVAVKSGRGTKGIWAKHARVIRRFVAVREALWDVLEAQRDERPYGEAQAALGAAYDAFVDEFGPINLQRTTRYVDAAGDERETQRRPNLQPFLDDPDCWLVASAELYDPETDEARRGPIFTDLVIRPRTPRRIVTIDDALAVVLDERGSVDIDEIAALLRIPREQAVSALGDRVFHDPADGWQTRDEYLSGKVRTKLAQAEAAAADDPRYERNVAALRLAQPQDVNPSDITARLGAPWIPTVDIDRFCREVMGIETKVRHVAEVATWEVDLDAFRHRAQATAEWGTHRRHAGQLLHDALNATVPQVYDTWEDEAGSHRELNATETEAAKEKLVQIKRAFEAWIWGDAERTDRLVRLYNDLFNDLVPREFDGSHLTLPGASAAFEFYAHQKRAIWRIIATGDTYVAHAVGSGKTITLAAAVIEQKRLGLVSKPMLLVPGHCLAQTSREFLQVYPTARILVADDANFSREQRQRFVARATLGDWDCIVLTHSAFKLIPSPTAFERAMVQEQLDALERLADEVGWEDRTTRKRIELSKERLEEKLESLRGRRDGMVTIADMGVDQLIVDEAQAFRKLHFTTNSGGIKGVDPDGSQRAWDLYVKSRFLAQRRPGRALVLSSGTPITNTLGEMFTVQRFLAEDALRERGIHEFDAWASAFGDTVTELELQPSGKYKPATRFAEFVNVPELVAMFRSFADVVQRHELRSLLRLPAVRGGSRRIVTTERSERFRAYQALLDARIDKIEKRTGQPRKGDDILLSVITDGRHAAVDLRLVDREQGDEDGNKLNDLIRNVHRIWAATADRVYSGGGRPGAGQMVFSDIGTLAAAQTRGFSAYAWIKERLVAMGVPASEIAFVQNYKRAADKQGLFNDFNAGRVRVLVGSSETMGTGVNGQKRLVALHHLDVPWLPSQIEQREGRIERPGNENDEIEIYAYATLGSMDAPMWQGNERKARFIAMAMAGDRGIRRVEDVGSQASQFALAKAIASGDPRLVQKAGLEADIARLRRLRSAHFDGQHSVRSEACAAERRAEDLRKAIDHVRTDLERRVSTRGDAFRMEVDGRAYDSRKEAGEALREAIGRARGIGRGEEYPIGRIGGFAVHVVGTYSYGSNGVYPEIAMEFTARSERIEAPEPWSGLGAVARLESRIERLGDSLQKLLVARAEAERGADEYGAQVGGAFEFQAELDAKLAELREIDADLVKVDETAEPVAA